MEMLVLTLVAATPVQTVVLDVRVLPGADANLGAVVGEEVARALPAGAFKVTTQQQLATVLGLERQRQLAGCSEEASSCAAEVASALGADVVVQTTLAKIADGLRCSVTFV